MAADSPDKKHEVPSYWDLLWPAIQVLRDSDVSNHMDKGEVVYRVAESLGLSRAAQQIRTRNGRHYAFHYNMGWALTYLKKAGLVENPGRGIWIVSEAGRTVESEGEVNQLCKQPWPSKDTGGVYQLKMADVALDMPPSGMDSPDPYGFEDALTELFVGAEHFDRIVNALQRRKNLILQGPPGTGKTFMARRIAWYLVGVKDSRSIEMVQFHQSYAYEDFVQGYRPTVAGGFALRNGVFYEFCERARRDKDTPYVFIIDEINRGNMSRIFGELLMLIEADKRTKGYAASLTYGGRGERFFVPPNVYILGMMNTADRSLAVVDYALRRRFAFYELTPAFNTRKFEEYLLKNQVDDEVVARIQTRMIDLNDKIREDSELGSGFEIGHSYFVPNGPVESADTWYDEIIETQIAPLLREYWFDDQEKVRQAEKDLLAPGP